MAAIPVSIHPSVVLSELLAIGASATTRHDRIARTEARIEGLRADLAYAADSLGWESRQKERHLAEILKTLTEARQLTSTEKFAVLDRAIELLKTKGSRPPAQRGHRQGDGGRTNARPRSLSRAEPMEASMEEELFRYERAGTSAPERGIVIIEFRRPEGKLVEISLAVDDARRMCDDLRKQIGIATPRSR
jgi:hypothetical protein